MRILNVNVTLDPILGGGTAERTIQMSRFLKSAGEQCAILTLNIGLNSGRLDELSGIPVTALRCVLPRYYVFPVPEPRITELVRWADVVHLMNHWTLLNALVYRVARREGTPYVVCPAGALHIYGRSPLLKKVYNGAVGHDIIRNARACVAISSNEIDQFRKYGVLNDRVTVIPNGIDPNGFRMADPESFRKKFDIDDVPFILFVGRLNMIKGPDLLLQAFARIQGIFKNLHLVFAGSDGGMLDTLKTMAQQTNVSGRVRFIGHVSGSDKAGAYRAARLLVIPSRQEAMSIVVLEAGICGTPVLITDQCGFDEVQAIGGGKVVSASADALESGLLDLLRDATALCDMGRKLRDHVLQHFLWESMARRYVALFHHVLGVKL